MPNQVIGDQALRDQALRGKVALVTGAGRGLGAAVARALGAEGAAVACLDVRAEAAAATSDELRACDGRALGLGCDVADPPQVEAAVAHVAAELGGLDILVNNAAVDHTVSVAEMSLEQWDQVLDVNLRAPFLLARAAWPHLRLNGGHVVNVASTAATRAWANAAAYHASKWGLVGFSRSLGVEGRPHNIRVTTIIPGGMRTGFFDRFAEQGIPMPDPAKLQEPSTVASAILFALKVPAESVLQELILTPLDESSWP
jgi:NAD(P)-dependent dehydrogenase (short-subunit alcohol dehydrogenase family)